MFVAGHILNQISVFLKLVRFSMSKDSEDPIEANVSGMQSQLILRSLIGVLAEAIGGEKPRVDLEAMTAGESSDVRDVQPSGCLAWPRKWS